MVRTPNRQTRQERFRAPLASYPILIFDRPAPISFFVTAAVFADPCADPSPIRRALAACFWGRCRNDNQCIIVPKRKASANRSADRVPRPGNACCAESRFPARGLVNASAAGANRPRHGGRVNPCKAGRSEIDRSEPVAGPLALATNLGRASGRRGSPAGQPKCTMGQYHEITGRPPS